MRAPRAICIQTPRLELVPATTAMVRAEMRGPAEFEAVLGARVPADWPTEVYEPAVQEWTLARLEENPEHPGWWMHYFVLRGDGESAPELIGVGGYKGPPSADGTVELGYAVLTPHQRRGYAAEATRGMLAHAFAHAEVTRVIAHTLPELEPSLGVLRGTGFRPMAESLEEGAIGFEVPREEWERIVREAGGPHPAV